MGNSNSKNTTLIIVLLCVAMFTFSVMILSKDIRETIYTDVEQAEYQDED